VRVAKQAVTIEYDTYFFKPQKIPNM